MSGILRRSLEEKKIIYVHCGEEMNITDPRGGDHN